MTVEEAFKKLESDLIKEDKLNQKGKLTIGRITRYGFYRLLDGEHANKIIFYSRSGMIDNKEIIHFVNHGTWSFKKALSKVKCEVSFPSFLPAINPVKLVHWYGDGGDGPYYHKW